MSEFSRKKRFDAELANQQPGTLSWFDLTAYGVAAVVGSGIFATVGRVALQDAGLLAPLSVLIAGGLSLTTAICYLEFASALPVSGSAYAYFYGMVGEAWGFLAGWNLTLEYAFAAAAIANAWGDGLKTLLLEVFGVSEKFYCLFKMATPEVTVFPVASFLVVLIGIVVSKGVKMGAKLTNAVSILNVSLILLIIVVGAVFVSTDNWTSVETWTVPAKGWSGVVEGGSHMFFAYIGYDTVSTLSTDAADPSKSVPIAVFLTLAIATVLYMSVIVVLSGMVQWSRLSAESSLVRAFQSIEKAKWFAPIVSVGSLTTMAATVMACLLGQPKIFKAMADDGLLPFWMAGSDKRALYSTLILTAGLAFFVDFNDPSNGINDAISFGVLLGMSCICAALLVVRFERAKQLTDKQKWNGSFWTVSYLLYCLVFSFVCNNATNHIVWALFAVPLLVTFVRLFALFSAANTESLSPAFTCPLMPVLPAVAILANSLVLMSCFWTAIVPFAVWTGLGVVIYVVYGRMNSRLTGKYSQ